MFSSILIASSPTKYAVRYLVSFCNVAIHIHPKIFPSILDLYRAKFSLILMDAIMMRKNAGVRIITFEYSFRIKHVICENKYHSFIMSLTLSRGRKSWFN